MRISARKSSFDGKKGMATESVFIDTDRINFLDIVDQNNKHLVRLLLSTHNDNALHVDISYGLEGKADAQVRTFNTGEFKKVEVGQSSFENTIDLPKTEIGKIGVVRVDVNY